VHGAGGLDELSPIGATEVCEIHQGQLSRFSVHPQDFGVTPSDLSALRVDSVAESHKVALGVLAGQVGPARDIVLMNAAAGLLVAGRVETLADGMRSAGIVIDDGRASGVLDLMVTCSKDVGNG
jgi:anthranilate phosphoribosyltransferase